MVLEVVPGLEGLRKGGREGGREGGVGGCVLGEGE